MVSLRSTTMQFCGGTLLGLEAVYEKLHVLQFLMIEGSGPFPRPLEVLGPSFPNHCGHRFTLKHDQLSRPTWS